MYLRDLAWTAAEEITTTGPDVDAEGREALARVGDRIDEDLAALEQNVAVLRHAFVTYPDWVNSGVQKALRTEHFTAAQRTDALRRLGEGGDFAGRGAVLAHNLTTRIPGERTALAQKISNLRAAGPIVTDLDAETGCGIATITAMGLMAAGAIGAEPLLVVGAGIMIVTMTVC